MDNSNWDNFRINYLDPRLSTYNNFQVRTDLSSSSTKIDEYQDRQFISNWLLEKGKFQLSCPSHIIKKPKTEIGINLARNYLKKSLEILAKLKSTQEELRNNVETMSTNEWKQKTLDIGSLRDELDKSMLIFEDKTNLSHLKYVIKTRTRKRLNQKKQKKLRQEMKKAKIDKRLEAHKNIDRWLESKKEEVERTKMEEKMKKDADCVLYEVTKKKSEARKQLSLISSLVKLRTVRDNMATQRGERLSLEDRNAFGSVTEKLVRMWEDAYQNYCKEEQCLQLMLEHNADKDSKTARLTKENQIIREWRDLLFGPSGNINPSNSAYWALTNAERDMETFIAIRKSWDTFLTTSSNPSGSNIPIGWVIPPKDPCENWMKYLKQD